jgi:hypothetical protein
LSLSFRPIFNIYEKNLTGKLNIISMNRKRDIEQLGDLYLENFKVEGVNEPDEFKKEKNATNDQKGAGPENAEGVNAIADVEGKTDKNDALNIKNLSDPKRKKNSTKGKELTVDSINISKMSDKTNNKSDFDKLYEFAMEGEGDFEDMLGGGLDDDLGDDLGGDDDLGGEDKVVVELSRECAAELHEVLMAKMGEDDLGDDMDGEGDLEDLDDLEDGTLPEKVVSEPQPRVLHTAGLGQHPEAGNKANMKAKAPGEPVANGTAETGNVDEDPTPKPLGGSGERKHKDVGSKKNKVDARKKNTPGAHMHGA